jgi:hypothetical protein
MCVVGGHVNRVGAIILGPVTVNMNHKFTQLLQHQAVETLRFSIYLGTTGGG